MLLFVTKRIISTCQKNQTLMNFIIQIQEVFFQFKPNLDLIFYQISIFILINLLMQAIHFNDLVQRFSKVPLAELKWLTPVEKLQSLIVQDSQEPENLKNTFFDPNDFFIQGKFPKTDKKHKQSAGTKEFVMGKKTEQKKEKEIVEDPSQEKKKVYRPGPFALFYELNENKLDKDDEVWYYKAQKDIIGPVSSYNMDKMVYYKNVEDETKVAYKSIEKFVKFSKIRKVVDSNKKQTNEEPISSEQSQ